MSGSEFYQVVKIEGKGFGCVATKDIKRGTLILREKAQIFDKETAEKLTPNGIKSVVKSFKQMSKNNQDEFLKLHNKFLDQDLSKFKFVQTQYRSIVCQMYESGHEQEKILAILCILKTNAFDHDHGVGVGIHASRFNHSCFPNLMISMARSGEIFVRTIKKIKAGEEITISYNKEMCIMKIRQTRQKYLKETFNFICACNCCKDGREDIEAFEEFAKLFQDAKSFEAMGKEKIISHQNPIEVIPFLKKEICCHKDMYNLGRKKKAAKSFLYKGVYLS